MTPERGRWLLSRFDKEEKERLGAAVDFHFGGTFPAVNSLEEEVERALSEEVTHSSVAKERLDNAWKAIDEQKAINQRRQQLLLHDLPAKIETSLDQAVYWDDAILQNRFDLRSVIDKKDLGSNSADQGLKVMLKSEGASKLGEHGPLRRCFAPVVRQRDSISKSFTLLLNSLQEAQKKCVPLEEEMERSMFDLPFAAPLRHLAETISRVILKAQSGSEAEQHFHREMAPRLAELRALYESLVSESNPRRITAALHQELREREELQEYCLKLIRDAVEAEKKLADTLQPACNAMKERYEADLLRLRENTEQITASAMAVVNAIQSVSERGESVMDGEASRHHGAMEGLLFKMRSAEVSQEKIQRRIREEIKAFHKEQQVHETAMKEAVLRLVAHEQLQVAKKQFESACRGRTELLQTASERCQFLNGLVDKLDDIAKYVIDQTEKHCSRTLGEESFRKMRVSKSAVENTMAWSRCIGDLAYQQRHRLHSVTEKMSDSWQLQYLLGKEQSKLKESLDDLGHEKEKVEAAWKATAVYLAEFKIPIPSLSRVDSDPTVISMRNHFLSLDSSPTKAKKTDSESHVTLPPVPHPRGTFSDAQASVLSPKPPPRRTQTM